MWSDYFNNRNRKRIAFFLVFLLLLLLPLSSVAETDPSKGNRENSGSFLEKGAMTDLAIQAKSAVLLDAGTGEFLYLQDARQELPPASVTKVMTMLLTLEAAESGKISLDDPVTISSRAASMGGSQMFMEPGETQTIATLLKGMAICSANDACVACAEYVGGTEEIFVEMMNARAKELGMKNSHFVNTNGLPVTDHYTSAYDIGIMSRELLKFEETRQWFLTWQDTVTVGKEGKKKTELGLTNTNRLIRLYPGAIGIKTGFTQDAGYCLSGAAEKNGLTLIAVVLGCETTGIRWDETMRLLDYGFANYESYSPAEAGTVLGTVPVGKGAKTKVNVILPEAAPVLLKKGQSGDITSETILRKQLTAPVKNGAKAGELVIRLKGKEIARYPLVAAENVEKAVFGDIYIRMMKSLL